MQNIHVMNIDVIETWRENNLYVYIRVVSEKMCIVNYVILWTQRGSLRQIVSLSSINNTHTLGRFHTRAGSANVHKHFRTPENGVS
jgi:hypothetical protein